MRGSFPRRLVDRLSLRVLCGSVPWVEGWSNEGRTTDEQERERDCHSPGEGGGRYEPAAPPLSVDGYGREQGPCADPARAGDRRRARPPARYEPDGPQPPLTLSPDSCNRLISPAVVAGCRYAPRVRTKRKIRKALTSENRKAVAFETSTASIPK